MKLLTETPNRDTTVFLFCMAEGILVKAHLGHMYVNPLTL